MKHTLLILTIVLSSCQSQINQSDLNGEWNVTKLNANTPGLSPILIQGAREEAISTSYWFNQDGSYKETSNSNPIGKEGLWEFHPSNNLLELTDEGVSGQIFIVKSVDTSKMIWFDDMKELGSLTYELTRIK